MKSTVVPPGCSTKATTKAAMWPEGNKSAEKNVISCQMLQNTCVANTKKCIQAIIHNNVGKRLDDGCYTMGKKHEYN